MVFNLYVPQTSWAHRVDPRVKLLFVGSTIVITTLFSNLLFMLAALAFVHLLMAAVRLPRERYLWVWRAMGPINLMIPLLWMFFYSEGTTALHIWRFSLTPLAFVRGMVVVARLDTIAFACAVWLSTTEPRAIVQSLVKLGIPYEWGVMFTIGLRYIPTFYSLYTAISEAQQARALDPDHGPILRRLRARIPILTAMIITALHTAERLALTLESRAMGAAGVSRTCWHDLHFSRRDVLFSGGLVLLLGAALALRVAGLFVHPLYLP